MAADGAAAAIAKMSLSDLEQRNQIFDRLWAEHKTKMEQISKPDLFVTLVVNGKKSVITAQQWQSTPAALLRHVDAADKSALGEIVVAKVDGKQLWDLDRPLEFACELSYIPFSSVEGRNVFWHSSAHVLGEACELVYEKCLLSHGPPVEQGFFYDMALAEGQAVKETDWKPLKEKAQAIIKEKQPFERLHVSLEDLREMFSYSKYKLHYVDNLLPKEGSIVYRCGKLVDLCAGPHIQHTKKIATFDITKNASCYFLGDKDGDALQRVYGVAFPDKKLLAEWKKLMEEAAKRDHRRIGQDQELFFFDELSAGSPFLLPHGTIIFNNIQKMLRSEYFKRGYQEVQSPNMYDSKLWQTSGHWQHYRENMFLIQRGEETAKKEDQEKKSSEAAEQFALKAMNCPGHCLIFKHRERSYRELPIRMADFGVLHRNEASGALHGLTRVRKFQQDDAHHFVMDDQITEEIEGIFDFLKTVYSLFGFTFRLLLSTRPANFLGEIATWDVAESKLKQALDNFAAHGGGQWELNEGDGAFYGPKIDIEIQDALKRGWQCATIQLDFQLPQNFQLEYQTAEIASKAEKDSSQAGAPPKEGEKKGEVKQSDAAAKTSELGPGRARPVMIHRAIVGSFERFFAIIIEHFGGKWPFWLSPRQVLIVPVMPALNKYVLDVQKQLRAEEFHADVDISGNTMPKKILRGQQAQYNFIFVLGGEEEKSQTVNVRNRDDPASQKKGELVPLQDMLVKLRSLRDERRLENKL